MAGQIIPQSVYVVIEDDAILPPGVECKFVRASELDQLPDEAYSVVNNKGFQVRKKTRLVSGLVSLPSISFLSPPVTQNVKINIPKIPGSQLMRAVNFFREVYNKYDAESELMIVFNRDTNQFDYYCPKQEVSHGSVDYDLPKASELLPDNCNFVGTIHSHCNFGAFHSSTDTNDEKSQDGLHITIGNVDLKNFSYAACVVANGVRQAKEAHEVIENIYKTSETFDSKVEEDEEDDGIGYYTGKNKYRYTTKKKKYKTYAENLYNVDLTPAEASIVDSYDAEIKNWVKNRVSKLVHKWYGKSSWQGVSQSYAGQGWAGGTSKKRYDDDKKDDLLDGKPEDDGESESWWASIFNRKPD